MKRQILISLIFMKYEFGLGRTHLLELLWSNFCELSMIKVNLIILGFFVIVVLNIRWK